MILKCPSSSGWVVLEMSGEGWDIPQSVFKAWGTHPNKTGTALRSAGTVPYIRQPFIFASPLPAAPEEAERGMSYTL